MNGFSTVDGFVEITESLAEMIKYVANEPSVGLFYVQQHAQNAVPNVVNLNHHILEKSREATLHTEDLEDSITMVRSMKDSGVLVADDMIDDIRNSLSIMSAKQPKKGLIHSSSSSFQTSSSGSWGPVAWGRGSGNLEHDGNNYLSTVFKSAKQKASNFKWPQLEPKEQIHTVSQKQLIHPTPPLSFASASTSSSVPDIEADELPLSVLTADEHHEEEEEQKEEAELKARSSDDNLFFENYDDYKADREAKLEQWLLADPENKID